MEITIHSTEKIVQLNGIHARVWQGKTASGIEVHAFITRIAIDKTEPRSQEFEKELMEHEPPTPEIQAFPLRMII